jgi:hypothetical protein
MNNRHLPSLALILIAVVFVFLSSQLFVKELNAIRPRVELEEKNYILKGKGVVGDDQNSRLDLQLITAQSTSKRIMLTAKGSVLFAGKYYVVSKDWKVTLYSDGKLMRIMGDADDGTNEKIFLEVIGKRLEVIDGVSTYELQGELNKSNKYMPFKVIYTVKIAQGSIKLKFDEQKPIPVSHDKITLISLHTAYRNIGDSYWVTARTYDAKTNPNSNFDQNWGYLPEVNISVNILDEDGKVVKKIEGLTQKFGYFAEEFRIPDNFPAATYQVTVTAKKDGYEADSDQLWLHVFGAGNGDLGSESGSGSQGKDKDKDKDKDKNKDKVK